MIITAQIAGQTVGTGSNKGTGLFPQKVTADAATAGFSIATEITNGVSSYNPNQSIRIWYTSSPFSYTAALAVTQLRQQAISMDIRPDTNTGAIQTKTTDLAVLLGTYIYFWYDIPLASVAQSLSADVVEI